MRICRQSLFIGLLIAPLTAVANDPSELKELKAEIENIYEEMAILESTSDNWVNVSGYADVEYSGNDKTESSDGFHIHHLSLFFEKHFEENLSFFSEIEFEDAPKFESNADSDAFKASEGKIFVEAVNMTYSFNSKVSVRVGRMFTPAGIWSEDHYPPFVPTQDRPLHVRNVFPQLVDGVAIRGTIPMDSIYLNYNVYTGNGEGNSGHNDNNSAKAFGATGTFILPAQHLKFGATFYTDTLNDNTDKTSYGAHVKGKFNAFTVQAEYANARLVPVDTGGYDVRGFYIQGLYNYKDWTFGGRYDVFDKNTSDDEEHIKQSVFVNYHVNPTTTIKAEYHINNFEIATDYNSYILSFTTFLGK
ncbi:MAG: porin [Colwellia sp.]|nr:porin [Colwellia sp.]